jgi:chromosome segregation ATPase
MAKQKLVESFTVNGSTLKKIPLTEATKIVEKDGKEYKCRAAYELPVWRLGEKNLNERVYGKELAEKLMKDQPVTLGLANHPKQEADVTYTFAVERNPHIKENIMYVDAYLVGDNGELANEIIEAGGSIGLSSSAYGDVDKDGNVQLEGFEIERFCDWVDMPSYEVYAGTENVIGVEKKSESIEKDTTNIIMKEKENKDMSNKNNTEVPKTKSLEEKNLRLGVRNLLKEADTKDSLQEKLEVYREVIDYCGDSEFGEDYVKQAAEKIEEIQQQIYELADKGKEVDKLKEDSEKTHKELEEKVESLEEENTSLKEQYETATQLLDDMKTREQKIREMYESTIAEKNGMVTAEEYQELAVYLEGKEKELEEALEENRKLKKKVKTYMERAAEGIKEADKKKDDDDEEDNMDDDEEEEKDEEKYDKKKKKESVVEDTDYHFVRDNKQVRAYYEDLVLENPNVEKIKDEILGCGTLFEAQKKYLNLKDLVEDIPTPKKRLRMSEDEEETPHKRKTQINIREGWL